MDGMSEQALEVRRNYKRQYRIRNQEKINSQQRMWRKKNPDKVKEYQKRYWEKRAKNLRASWKDYGINKERLNELWEIVKSSEYSDIVHSIACAVDEKAAEYILKSIIENKSYDALRAKWELKEMEQIPYCRTDFYGIRRLFFHYLDCALNAMQEVE